MSLPDERLAAHGTFAAAISCFDTVNYLARPGQLIEVFRQVGQCLLPGGLFIFDTNTRYKLEKFFGHYHSGDDFEDFSYVWRNNYSAADHTCYINLTFFVRDADGRYERFTERHAERWFTQEELTMALTAGNMQLIQVSDAYSDNPVKDDATRTTWVAERLPAPATRG
jgi:SAM-dependent methyltransferase